MNDQIKEKWMAEHQIILSYNWGANEWCAEVIGTDQYACHIDPDGALHNLAVKLGIKDWEGN